MKPFEHLAVLCLLIIFALGPSFDSQSSALAGGPCDTVTGDPRPPIGEPEPLIAGTIVDLDAGAGAPGVTVEIYRCVDGSPSLAGSTTTDSSGGFGFTSLGGPSWYYVEVSPTGPLTGLNPASGTSNPTAPIDIGPGDATLYLEFGS